MEKWINFINNKSEIVNVLFSVNYKGFLSVQTFVTDKNGNCKECYNPTIEKEVVKNNVGMVQAIHMIVKPEYREIENTEENRNILLDKIKELAND